MAKLPDDNFLYQYIPQAEEKWIKTIENSGENAHAYSEEFQKKLKEITKLEKRRKNMKQIVAVAVIVLITFFTGCMSIQAARAKLFDTIQRIYKDCVEYIYDTGATENMERENILIEPDYLPDGYQVFSRNESMGIICYRKDAKDVDTEKVSQNVLFIRLYNKSIRRTFL
jgi:hypothetical protein